jgi:bacillithiol biosynthesis deacetylase BshB1
MPKKDETVDMIFFAAHADDLELCCGATIAHFASNGARVGMLELTRGEMGTRGTPQTRKKEAEEGRRILGAAFREHLDFGDGGLQKTREHELQLVEAIRRYKPKMIFAPWPDERHPDHTRTGELVTSAWFYSGLRALKSKRDAHRPQAVAYYLMNYMLHPSFIVDCSKTWATKLKAIAAFKSQFYNPKSNEPQTFISTTGFLEMIEARGRHFGALIGASHGEAYVTKQPPKIQDVISAYSGREV